jgi:PAS domain S-box-containing protein
MPEPSGLRIAPGHRILIVEDDDDLREMLAERLRPHFEVTTAVDGQAALELARAHRPDLVLCDVVMPRLDGLGLLRALRGDPHLARIAFILLSARGGEPLIEALEAGADDYLIKPIGGRELLARVRAYLALARPRDVIERFFELSLDLVCIAGIDGYFRRVSPAFAVLGWSEAELLRRPFLDFVHPADVPATRAEVDKLARGEPTIHFENRYRCKDGGYRWIAWTSAPDDKGTLYCIGRDVTEARRNADELAHARDTAEAANRELESFSYSVAHDLRGPLRSIDGFSQALVEDYGELLEGDGRRYLGFVRESAQQMAELIDDLLALSRVTRSELHRTDVDVSELARAAVARLQRAHPARDVAVTIADDLRGQGDPRLLAIVLDNLLGNAWKFTSRRARAHVEVGATTADGAPAFFVRDDGAGFDMTFAGKLFGVFQRLHAASEFEGTGVGLATVQRVIRRHGGKVWAEGEVDHGATFYFTLGPAPGFTAGQAGAEDVP